jgi:outer membrane receptor protein involved in Fe transport
MQGDLWTSFSYSLTGEVWDSLSDIEDFANATTPEEEAAALEFRYPKYKSGTFQFGYASDTDWDVTFIVRNVFDDRGVNWMSGTNRGALFDDPRWRYVRGLQPPRSYALSFTKKW